MPRPIAAAESRRILLAAQGLAAAPGRRAGPAGVLQLIERLGFVQLDAINVLERSELLVLHARLDGDPRPALRQLLEKDRTLFEHWTHDASVIPTAWHPLWRRRFRRFEQRLRARPGFRQRLGPDPDARLRDVEQRMRREGPLRSQDLVSMREDRKHGGWWDWHPGKASLEFLWLTGRAAITARRSGEKVYDLVERVLPERALRAEEPAAEEHLAWACRSALARLGVATAKEIADFWEAVKVTDVRAFARAATASGEWEAVELLDGDGKRRAAFAHPDSERLAKTEPLADRIRLLSPFDPVVRDRARLLRRFGFDYRFEAFTPRAKRRYGYYVLPFVRGDTFLGRIDPKLHRENAELTVRGPFWERGARSPENRRLLENAVERLAGFTGAERWRFVREHPGR